MQNKFDLFVILVIQATLFISMIILLNIIASKTKQIKIFNSFLTKVYTGNVIWIITLLPLSLVFFIKFNILIQISTINFFVTFILVLINTTILLIYYKFYQNILKNSNNSKNRNIVQGNTYRYIYTITAVFLVIYFYSYILIIFLS